MKKPFIISFLFFAQFLLAQVPPPPPPPPPAPQPGKYDDRIPQHDGKVVAFNPGTLPEFPGGDPALQQFVQDHLVLDKKQLKTFDGDIVDLTFTIDSTGQVCNLSTPLVKAAEMELEAAQHAVDILAAMPKWTPGHAIYSGEDYVIGVRLTMKLYYPVKTDSTTIPARVIMKRMFRSHLGTRDQEAQQIFSYTEVMPSAVYDFQQYLVKNLKYPAMEKESNIQGTVYVSFVVERDGTISNVAIRKGVNGGAGLEYEAARVIAGMPNWTPGTMKGQPVRVEIIQPVRFRLQ